MRQPTGQQRCAGEISTNPIEGSKWNIALGPLLFCGARHETRTAQVGCRAFYKDFFFFPSFFFSSSTWSSYAGRFYLTVWCVRNIKTLSTPTHAHAQKCWFIIKMKNKNHLSSVIIKLLIFVWNIDVDKRWLGQQPRHKQCAFFISTRSEKNHV